MSTIKNLAADTAKLAEVPTIESEVLATIEEWQPESDTVSLRGTGRYGHQPTKEEQHAKARKLLAHGTVSYSGNLGTSAASKMIADPAKVLRVANGTISRDTVLCAICGRGHGRPEETVDGLWKQSSFATNPMFVQNGKPFFISKSCIVNYLIPNATPANLPAIAGLKAKYTPQSRKGK